MTTPGPRRAAGGNHAAFANGKITRAAVLAAVLEIIGASAPE